VGALGLLLVGWMATLQEQFFQEKPKQIGKELIAEKEKFKNDY
jgi:hypothetical protein